jgi:hypothetical protein
MRDAGYTKQERHLITLLRLWMVLFFVGGVTFVVAPEWTVRYIENIGRAIFGWTSPSVTFGTERFWLVLVASLMATLTFLAYKAQSNLLRTIWYTGVILISKFVSTAGFIVCFVMVQRSFLYLAGAAVDGSIFILTAVLYHSALKSRSRM